MSGQSAPARADVALTGTVVHRADGGDGRVAHHPSAVRVTLTIGAHARWRAIPRSFFGFSTEYGAPPIDARHPTLYRRLISLVHVPGDGPFVLRIGGSSSDRAFWHDTTHPLPDWAIGLTTAWVRQTSRLVRANRLRVIIDLNLITGSSATAARWARAAEAQLPRHSIIGFEIGNEPDIYSRRFWRDRIGVSPRQSVTPLSYTRDYAAYASALTGQAAGVPLLGPALAEPRRDHRWIATLLGAPHSDLGSVSVHEYPFTACARPGTPTYPTIGRLLSQRASAGMAAAIGPAIALARAHGLAVRATEFNSVTCGGVSGVSESFATALWAPDALFELARAGIAAAALHVRAFSNNTPIQFTRHGARVRPLLYGLIMFKRMLGPQSRLIASPLGRWRPAHLKVWAVRVGAHKLNVLLINKRPQPLDVSLRLPAHAPAHVQLLTAPAARSTSGETLAGQHLDRSLRWRGRPQIATVARRGSYHVAVPGLSAALVSVTIDPGTLPTPAPNRTSLLAASVQHHPRLRQGSSMSTRTSQAGEHLSQVTRPALAAHAS
ncbi:MAG: glycosyl hydrolase family 79 C-terminal domain-containing protein [Actinomycetota bacterium]|nr:glycosyl hydrolase family 79 C-terminal domain-containing protein [Actinomycetota bacterium]